MDRVHMAPATPAEILVELIIQDLMPKSPLHPVNDARLLFQHLLCRKTSSVQIPSSKKIVSYLAQNSAKCCSPIVRVVVSISFQPQREKTTISVGDDHLCAHRVVLGPS